MSVVDTRLSGPLTWSCLPYSCDVSSQQLKKIVEKHNEIYEKICFQGNHTSRKNLTVFIFLGNNYEIIGQKLPDGYVEIQGKPIHSLKITLTASYRNFLVDLVTYPELQAITYNLPLEDSIKPQDFNLLGRIIPALEEGWRDYGTGRYFTKENVKVCAEKTAELCRSVFNTTPSFPTDILLYLDSFNESMYVFNAFDSVEGFTLAKGCRSKKDAYKGSAYKVLCRITRDPNAPTSPTIEFFGGVAQKNMTKFGNRVVEILNKPTAS